MQATSSHEALELMRKHTREELSKVLEYAEQNFELTVTSFLHENLRGLRRAMGSVKFEKQLIKQMKRTGTLAMCRLDNNTVLEKGLYYYQGNDFASELVYSVGRLCEPCLEHIDNLRHWRSLFRAVNIRKNRTRTCSRTSARIDNPSSIPTPRKLEMELRLALSKLDL